MGNTSHFRYAAPVRGPGKIGIVLSSVCLLLAARPVRAHHSPGHGPSETLRTLGALGSNPAPRQRVAVLGQVERSSDEPTLNSATSYGLSVLTTVELAKRWFLSAQVPVVLVDQDEAEKLEWGLGDVQLGAQLRVGDVSPRQSASYVLGVSLTIPTRTVTYLSDPGRQWVASPGFRYADAHQKMLWYAMALLPFETRPSGTSFESSVAAGLGIRPWSFWAISGGASADVRILTWCRGVDSTQLCREGRATESNRPQGATRVYAHAASTLDLKDGWSLLASAQVPVTARRDVNWLFSLGVEARF